MTRSRVRAGRAKGKKGDAQFALAKEYGFASWRALKAHVDSLTVEGQFFDAARKGDLATVDRLLNEGADPNMREGGDNTYAMQLLTTDY